MTGMPAFEKTHDEMEIWGLVAYIRAAAGLSPEQYGRLTQFLAGGSHNMAGITGDSELMGNGGMKMKGKEDGKGNESIDMKDADSTGKNSKKDPPFKKRSLF